MDVNDGQVFQYEGYDQVINEETKKISLARSLPSQEYNDLIVPEIPAVDLQMKITDKKDKLPYLLRNPLIKKKDGKIQAFTSGVRSAIIKTEGKYFRLKGCGNNYDKFPLLELESNKEWKQIRGCCFTHTANRELVISGLVEKLLEKENMGCGNLPLGWFEYNVENHPYPNCKKVCGVFECRGERRLGAHLLAGAEEILKYLVPKWKNFEEKSFLGKLSENRKGEFAEGIISSTWWVKLEHAQNVTEHLIDLNKFVKDSNESFETTLPNEMPSKVDKRWTPLYKQNLEKLQKSLSHTNKGDSLLSVLYFNIGRECGKAMRAFNSNKFCWGTYVDNLGTHCNAHINNFIVIPTNQSVKKHDSPILACVDFDMGFTKDEFSKESEKFESWLSEEIEYIQITIAASPFNTGVVPTEEELIGKEHMNLMWALRDTYLLGFHSGLKGEYNPHPIKDQNMRDGIDAIIALSLMFSSDAIA